MTGMEMALGFGTVAATAVGTFVGLKIAPLERENDQLATAIKDLKEDAKDAREKLESRLQAIEKTYIDRAELNKVVESFGAKMDRSTERIEAVVMALGTKVDHLAERVGKVENT